jgi:hypothetical protein
MIVVIMKENIFLIEALLNSIHVEIQGQNRSAFHYYIMIEGQEHSQLFMNFSSIPD